MRKTRIALTPGVAAALLCAAALTAADTESAPFPGARHVRRHVTEPREIDMHIVIVDLNQPGVRITTTGPNDDPDTQFRHDGHGRRQGGRTQGAEPPFRRPGAHRRQQPGRDCLRENMRAAPIEHRAV